MPKYNFTAVDAKGKEASGTVEADSVSMVHQLIKEQGYFPSEVTEVGEKPAKAKKAPREKKKAKPAVGGGGAQVRTAGKKTGGASMQIGSGRVKPKELMVFTRQLATLVEAGLPLVRGLEVLERQSRNPAMKNALVDMTDTINGGGTFADSLAQHPKIFDKLFVNMIRAGEVGGVLDKVLESLAVFMEKMQKIKNKVVSAMAYPVVVMVLAVFILIFLMVFIIPKFQEIFDDILGDKPLPGLTRFVIAVSEGVAGNFFVTGGVIVALIVAFILIKRTEGGRAQIDRIKFRMPLFGPLIIKTGIARFCRTLGTLMNSGVPVLQALIIVRDTSGNKVLEDAVNVVHDAVKEGENIAPPLESTNVFPPMVVSMIEVGEETGELPNMLTRIADNYEDEVDNAVSALTSVIEPILIIFLAVVVGTIVIALFLPMISIIGSLTN